MFKQPTSQPGQKEFIALTAILMACIAMTIDIVLPALNPISAAIGMEHANDRQWIIACVFAGLTVGQLAFGPVSDTIGRRRAVFIGTGIFLVGTLVCLLATSAETMLLGRFLQGLGAAAPRIVTIAMIRDLYRGREMARIMSFGLTVFILVPVVAPSMGQAVLWFADWHALFYVLAATALIGAVWLAMRQPETLAEPRPFNVRTLVSASLVVFKTRKTMGYMFASACCFGPLIAFLNTAQQLYQDLYQTGDSFTLFFGGSALSIAVASMINGRLVQTYSMERICWYALLTSGAWSLGFVGLSVLQGTDLSLWQWQVFNCLALFLVGLTFGNMNAIMLEPLGHIAGTASAITAAISTLLAMFIGSAIGQLFDMTTAPMLVGYVICALFGLSFMAFGDRTVEAEQEG